MNTKLFTRIIAIAASSALLFGCTVNMGFNPNMTVGSGKIVTEPREVSGIKTVVVAGSGKLLVEHGDEESLTVTADDNILPLLTSNVVGGKLTLGARPGSSYSTRSDVVYKLTVKTLNGVTVSGSANAFANGVKAESFDVVLSGSGNLTASGSAVEQDITVSGSGNFDGEKLLGQMVNVKVNGSGNATVNVSDALNASASGSGNITFLGNPDTVNQKTSGSGKIARR